jgi:hypothetical protein
MKKGPKSSILRKIALNLPKYLSRYLLTTLLGGGLELHRLVD